YVLGKSIFEVYDKIYIWLTSPTKTLHRGLDGTFQIEAPLDHTTEDLLHNQEVLLQAYEFYSDLILDAFVKEEIKGLTLEEKVQTIIFFFDQQKNTNEELLLYESSIRNLEKLLSKVQEEGPKITGYFDESYLGTAE